MYFSLEHYFQGFSVLPFYNKLEWISNRDFLVEWFRSQNQLPLFDFCPGYHHVSWAITIGVPTVIFWYLRLAKCWNGQFWPIWYEKPRLFTLRQFFAISKCYGKVRVLFSPGDNSLFSARKSHSSGVRGLVVRYLLFNPEGSCSNPFVCANFLKSISKPKVLTVFRH